MPDDLLETLRETAVLEQPPRGTRDERMGVVEYVVADDGRLRAVRYFAVSGSGGGDLVFGVRADD